MEIQGFVIGTEKDVLHVLLKTGQRIPTDGEQVEFGWDEGLGTFEVLDSSTVGQETVVRCRFQEQAYLRTINVNNARIVNDIQAGKLVSIKVEAPGTWIPPKEYLVTVVHGEKQVRAMVMDSLPSHSNLWVKKVLLN